MPKMASKKKGLRKRKSAGVGDIFEVSEKDLSPEPGENDTTEPEAKILKTRNSDVSDSRKNNDQHNLSKADQNTEKIKILTDNPENSTVLGEKVDVIDITDESFTEKNDLQKVEVKPEKTECRFTCKPVHKPSGKNVLSKSKKKKKDKASILPTDHKTETNIVQKKTEEIFTIVDDQELPNENDVIMICDSSVDLDLTKETVAPSSPQTINDDTLEDGEVNDIPQEEPACVASPVPAITIQFSDKSVAEIYKHKFLKFIQSFVELNTENVDDTTLSIFTDGDLDPKEWVVLDHTLCLPEKNDDEELAKLLPATPKVNTPKKKKKKKKHVQQEELPEKNEIELFVVDTNPGAGPHIPIETKYSTKFLIDDEKKEEEKSEKSRPKSICFNCENEHALKDCPLPKNWQKINANRQKFQNKYKSSCGRYHLEEDQKYGNLSPGKLSAGLRKALGLKKHQIPSYVYQMRVLGYPPGWLEDAKFVSSELDMFDIDGKNVKNKILKKQKGLDPEKVVDYPGFNVPFEKDFKDEFKYYRVPPFDKSFGKENMMEAFKKLSQAEEDDLVTQDMDLDNTNDDSIGPPGIDDSVEETDILEENKQLDSSMDSDSLSEAALSLQELQKQKNTLLEAIKKSEQTIPWEQQSADTSQSSIDETVREESKEEDSDKNKDSTKKTDSEKDATEDSTKTDSKTTETRLDIKISDTSDTTSGGEQLDTNTNVNCVKTSMFGTPILKSSSPFYTLPDSDNFTKGVSPVIDFENLPNSTGKYEQMTGVLQKVRNALKNLQKPLT